MKVQNITDVDRFFKVVDSCNLVCLIDKIVQEDFNPNSVDKDFIKTMGIDVEDLEDLRQAVLHKAEVLIAELA